MTVRGCSSAAPKRTAAVESGARIVGFAKADYSRWDMMRGICRQRLSIQGHLAKEPTVLKVRAGSKAPQRLI